MAEKRKPILVILLKKEGKKKSNKVELFDGRDFGYYAPRCDKYRIRANGRWYPKGKKSYYSFIEVKNLIFKSINL